MDVPQGEVHRLGLPLHHFHAHGCHTDSQAAVPLRLPGLGDRGRVRQPHQGHHRRVRCRLLRRLHHGGAPEDGQERPLLPVRLVLRGHGPHREHRRHAGHWRVDPALLRQGPLVPHVHRGPGDRRADVPHQSPSAGEGGARGLNADHGCGDGLHAPVPLPQPEPDVVEPGRGPVHHLQHERGGPEEMVQQRQEEQTERAQLHTE